MDGLLTYFWRDPTPPAPDPIQRHIGRWDDTGTYITGLHFGYSRRLGTDSIAYDAATDTVYYTTEELVDNGDGTFSEAVKVWTAPGSIFRDEGGLPATEPLVTVTKDELGNRRILVNGDRLYLWQQWKVQATFTWTATLWVYDKTTGAQLDEHDLLDHDRDILGVDFIQAGGKTMLAVSDQALAPDLPHRVRSYDLENHAYTADVLCYPETQHPDPNYLTSRWLATRTENGVSTLWFNSEMSPTGDLCEFDLQGNLVRTLTWPAGGGTGGKGFGNMFIVGTERAYKLDTNTGYGDNFLTLAMWDLTTDVGTNVTPAFVGADDTFRYQPLAMCIGPIATAPIQPSITGDLVGTRRRFWTS